jgi:hypothetical protein
MVLKKVANFKNPPFFTTQFFPENSLFLLYVPETTGTHGSLILIFSLKTRTDGSLIMKFS